MHKSPTEILQNAQWRMATALRLGPPPDAGPRAWPCARATRAKRATTHWRGTLSVANTVVPGWTTSCCPVHTEQMDLPGWRTRRHGKTPVPRCAILDVVSCFPGVLQQLWIDFSVRCPHGERYNESASKPWVAAVAGEMEKTKRYGAAVRSLVFETYHI